MATDMTSSLQVNDMWTKLQPGSNIPPMQLVKVEYNLPLNIPVNADPALFPKMLKEYPPIDNLT